MGKKNLKETLSCPVCDKLPTPPVYGCQNGHIICDSCKANVRHCSVCRAERFCVRYLVVEELLSTKILPCDNEIAGCRQPLMTGLEYTLHLQTCPFRQIECDCHDGLRACQSELVPYGNYVDHLKDFHGAQTTEEKTMTVYCNIDGLFTPRIFQCYGTTFVLMSHRHYGHFWTWLAAMGTEMFYVRLTLRFKLPSGDTKSVSSDTLTTVSIRVSPEEVLKSGQCLEFSPRKLPDTAPPYVWPEYEAEDGEEFTSWGYDVEIWQPTRKPGGISKTSSVRTSNISTRSGPQPCACRSYDNLQTPTISMTTQNSGHTSEMSSNSSSGLVMDKGQVPPELMHQFSHPLAAESDYWEEYIDDEAYSPEGHVLQQHPELPPPESEPIDNWSKTRTKPRPLQRQSLEPDRRNPGPCSQSGEACRRDTTRGHPDTISGVESDASPTSNTSDEDTDDDDIASTPLTTKRIRLESEIGASLEDKEGRQH